ncbi:hypothetical protein ACFX2J_003985 [Malus domestica]
MYPEGTTHLSKSQCIPSGSNPPDPQNDLALFVMLTLVTYQTCTRSASELACAYATLILPDEGIPVTAEKIATLVKAANVPVESYWPGLFAKLSGKRNIEDLVLNAGSGGAVSIAAPGVAEAAAPAAAAPPPPEEKKKEEPKEESDDEGLFNLFD